MKAEGDRGLFDSAADAYDAARPDYPDDLYHLIASRTGGLAGRVVIDVGAGTGVASRQLRARHANVCAVDPGAGMLRRALQRQPGLRCVAADASHLPIASASVELACFAQAWHWVDQAPGAAEAARVLRHGGWWAAWWSHPWADAEPWFDEYYRLLEQRCPGVSRDQRRIERFAEAVGDLASFDAPRHDVVPWTRLVGVDAWLVDLTSHSYVIALAEPDRTRLLSDAEALLRRCFTDGAMTVPYETRLLMAQRR